MGNRSIAGQYSNPNEDRTEFMKRVQQAYDTLQASVIPGTIEIETGTRSIRVLVEPGQREAARTALKEILPDLPHTLKLHVDAATIRRVVPPSPTLMPGEEIFIGSSTLLPTGSTVHKTVLIQDDPKIDRQHLQVRWDGLNKLEIKDVSHARDARIGAVDIGSEWMEVEAGAKIQIGNTTVSFQKGDPIS